MSPDDEDFVPVRQAARQVKVSKYTVYLWAIQERVATREGTYGLLVSFAGVRALARARARLHQLGEAGE